MQSIYQVEGPSTLAGAPDVFSFSSLAQLRQCPRRYQLAHSQYYGVPTPYPLPHSPARVRGLIVHKVLEELLREFNAHAVFELETDAGRELMRRYNVRRRVNELLAQHEEAMRRNPRAARLSEVGVLPAECVNAALKLFRSVLADSAHSEREVEVHHPQLPLKGILDLVQLQDDDDVIIDYKAGMFYEEYLQQLELYALLWWRARGRIPARVRILAARGEARSVELEPTAASLQRLEQSVAEEIQRFQRLLSELAPSTPGEVCRQCPVRQICSEYWSNPSTGHLRWTPGSPPDSTVDIAVKLTQVRSASCVDARHDASVTITALENSGFDFTTMARGIPVRILCARVRDASHLTLSRFSEVFEI